MNWNWLIFGINCGFFIYLCLNAIGYVTLKVKLTEKETYLELKNTLLNEKEKEINQRIEQINNAERVLVKAFENLSKENLESLHKKLLTVYVN